MGSGAGQLDFPTGLATSPTSGVIVMDAGNQRAEIFGPDGSFVLAFGSAGSGPGQFNNPTAVDTGPTGQIIVMDKDNSRVQVFSSGPTSTPRTSWGALKGRWR